MVVKKCFCGTVGLMTDCDACGKPMCRKCAKHQVVKDILYIKHNVCMKRKKRGEYL